MKKALSLLLALSALLLCLVGCDSNKKSKLVEIERFSSMTLDGTTSIEVIYDYTKDGYATYEFIIEDREMIREIMTALFEVKLKDYPEDRDIDFYQRWLNVKQGETVYYVNLSYAADENENRYLLDSQAVCEIIEKYIEENIIGKRGTLSKPETDLEFWIAENVDGVDFSKYQIKYGLMGGTEYYGTGYVPTVDEHGQQIDPEHCVIYTVTSFPDYSDKEQHVTGIYITDPEVEFYGITVNSSFEDFENKIKAQGFEITTSNEHHRTAEKGKYSISITKEWIRIRVEVENKEGIIF